MANNAKIALLCAYTLASAKQYTEAEALILSDGELAKTTEAMDLLARVRAEQGDVAEARRLWQEIQALHPEHRPSRLALRNLGRSARLRSPIAALAILVLPLVLALGVVIGAVLPRPAAETRAELCWDVELPTAAHLETLEPYRGKVTSVCLSAPFFSDPSRVAHRALLAELIADRLDLAQSAIFIGEGGALVSPGTFTVTLLLGADE